MTDKKDLKSIYGGPVREEVKYPLVKQWVTIIGFTILGLVVPVAGLPVSILLRDQDHPKANILFVTSIIGFIIFIGIFAYGWYLHTNNMVINLF